MAAPFRIVFMLYPGLTQLDFTGPYEVLARMPGAEVVAASKLGGEVQSDTGLVFAGLARFADIERCDMICLPGGPGQTAAMLDQDFVAEVRRLGQSARFVTSVCTGSLILGAAGLIAGKRAACHWFYRDLVELFGAIPDKARVVRDGNLITGGGVTAGIDFALAAVGEIAGKETAQTIQLMLEYAPEPPFTSGRPEHAPAQVLENVRERFGAFAAARRQAIEELVDAAQPAA